eukprot:263489-Chlamydomonas_euryale.AAC.1
MGRVMRRAAATPPRLSARAMTPLAPGAVLLRLAIRSATSSTPGSAVAGSAAGGGCTGVVGARVGAAVRLRVTGLGAAVC